jgi:hypothetical protein
MVIGDDAVLAGMTLVSGVEQANTIDTMINQTRDFIAQGKIIGPLPVAKGGTSATNSADARQQLGIFLAPPNSAEPNGVPVYNGTGQLAAYGPTLPGHVANKEYVDARLLLRVEQLLGLIEALTERVHALENP